MIRSLLRILPLLLLIFSCILLLEGSHLLNQPLYEGSELPAGTFAAWLGISMLPLSILLGIRYVRKPISTAYRFYNRAFTAFTLLGALWGFVSYLLAGNWTYTFSGNGDFRGSEAAFNIFVGYSAILVVLSLLTFITFLIHHLIIKTKQKR